MSPSMSSYLPVAFLAATWFMLLFRHIAPTSSVSLVLTAHSLTGPVPYSSSGTSGWSHVQQGETRLFTTKPGSSVRKKGSPGRTGHTGGPGQNLYLSGGGKLPE
ncbi:hypothetical protein Q9L58_010512, partial [Maublancomyces gigas]